MQFTDLLEDFLAAKKNVDDLREQYNNNLYKYNCSFNEYYYVDVQRYQESRDRLNTYTERKSLFETRFGS